MSQKSTPYPTTEELDRIFESYSEEKSFENVLLKYKIRELLPFVVGPAVLDIGSGVGILCRTLADRVETVVGLDGSPAKTARAKEINAAPNITYVCALFEEWSSAGVFNTIIATNVLEHIQDSPAFLRRCHDLLAPGGRLIVTVPNALGLHKRIGKQMGLIDDFYALTEADRAKGHVRIYDRQRLNAEITAAGFTLLHSGGILLKPLSHQQMEAWDPRAVDALYEIGKELPDYCSSLITVATKGNAP